MRLRIKGGSGKKIQLDEEEKVQPSEEELDEEEKVRSIAMRKNESPSSVMRKNNNDNAPEEDINNLLNDLELLKGERGKSEVKKDVKKEKEGKFLNDLELSKGERAEREVKSDVKKEENGERKLPFEGSRAERGAGIADDARTQREQGEGWAISLLRSLDHVPDDMVAILPMDVIQKMLEGIAKSQGDVGILARVMLKRIKTCLEGK